MRAEEAGDVMHDEVLPGVVSEDLNLHNLALETSCNATVPRAVRPARNTGQRRFLLDLLALISHAICAEGLLRAAAIGTGTGAP